tara:strand:+ start:1961 stop:2221 length:261 start_codon:yes stop_codon:yes gene_type:complete
MNLLNKMTWYLERVQAEEQATLKALDAADDGEEYDFQSPEQQERVRDLVTRLSDLSEEVAKCDSMLEMVNKINLAHLEHNEKRLEL